jgi:hypothetical protein
MNRAPETDGSIRKGLTSVTATGVDLAQEFQDVAEVKTDDVTLKGCMK